MNPGAKDNRTELNNIARYLMASAKGLLAADESNKSATKRLEALNITSNPENRRRYRQMLFQTPDLARYISGVILYDETIRQSTDQGQTIPQFLGQLGIIPGIKVDKGLVELTNFAPEQITEGLDGLAGRLAEYHQMGARFTKWRAVFSVSDSTPTEAAIHANAIVFARYAALCQQAGLVPIVEPEVLYDGDHTLTQSGATIERVMKLTFEILKLYRVDLSGMILKTSMALPGKATNATNDPTAVAQATVAALKAAVPSDVAGIVFLSGGQTPEQATANFAAIIKLVGGQAGNANDAAAPQSQSQSSPWPLTFSFSRAVQDPAMTLWLGRDENTRAAQDAFAHRLAANSAARAGQPLPDGD